MIPLFIFKHHPFQITIFEHITDFAVGINYIDQGTNLLKPGLGHLKTKVPLGRNATFSFSYTSGKVYLVET